MSRPNSSWLPIVWLAALALSGCWRHKASAPEPFPLGAELHVAATQIEYPDVETPSRDDLLGPATPRTIRDMNNVEYWELSLEDAVRIALMNSRVLRDLGGTVIRSPDATATSFDPSVQETDPRIGVEAALSAFDAQLESRLFFEKIDRRLNNRFQGQLGFLNGDRDDFDTQLSKHAATGTQFFLRQHVDFDADNNPGNEFPNGAFNTRYEAEARHPLMQGGGLLFNRIAGPNGTPGLFNGVLIARTRTDIALADFEIALRDFVSNVENAYWDLYFAYRDLETKARARDTALETWRRIQALHEAGRRGGEAEKEGQAREQYFRFEAELQDALAGRPLDGTRTNNGSRPGTFRALPGVLVNERRLRLLMNIPANDGRLIRPGDEPSPALVQFDWWNVSAEALGRRSELVRQRWNVKRRELELLASRNYLLPTLDIVGQYRFRGFGKHLIDPINDRPRFDNAYADLTSGDFQEWQTGLEFSMPIGFRQAHVAVRNAELRLARERVVLDAQEREVISDLSLAVSELDRAYVVMQTNYNRWVAGYQQLAATEAAYTDDRVDFFAVLDAQRRFAESQSQHYRSRVEYAVAVKNVQFEKGTLLDHLGIHCSEGPWPGKAYEDAARLEARRGHRHWTPAPTPIISRDIIPPPVRLPAVE